MVPPGSDHVSRVWSYSGTFIRRLNGFVYGTFALFGSRFHAIRLPNNLVTPAETATSRAKRPTTPGHATCGHLHVSGLGYIRFRSPLLAESLLISFPQGTEMFHFPCLSSPCLCVQHGITPNYRCWVPPFGNPRIKGYSAPTRGLSQPFTPFIDSWCQGIHRVPFLSLR